MIAESVVLPNRYFDSVFLMKVAKGLSGELGVSQAAVVMGTPKNLEVLASAGYTGVDTLGARPNDLVVSLKAETVEQARLAFDSLDGWLQRDGNSGRSLAPRTLNQAVKVQLGSNLALISVPGQYAAQEARRALQAGLNVFLFSDNVSVEDELALKQSALEKGLIVMGPDCGTSIIGGAGIGFANVVRRGPIGVIGGSGTGIQEVTSLVHRWGSGISHAIGVGSRDLSDDIGGISALQAIQALEADPATSVILVLSKPPGKQALAMLTDRIGRCSKPVVTCFFGMGLHNEPQDSNDVVKITYDLDAAALAAVALTGGTDQANNQAAGPDRTELIKKERALLMPGQRFIRGVFAGGTLCYQAQQVMLDAGFSVLSNEPLEKGMQLADSRRSTGHTLLDLGADEFTQGHPHPMVDSSQRAERILAEADDPSVAVLLLDVILGYSAVADPAGDLAPAIRQAKKIAQLRGGHLIVAASICGTSDDPQGLDVQTRRLEDAGAIVFDTGFSAARFAIAVAPEV